MEFVTGIDKEVYQQFMQNHTKSHFLQSVLWGEFKSLGAWSHDLVGVKENGSLIACAMVLKRTLIGKSTLLYMPRGFVMDYNNEALFSFFTQQMVVYAKHHKAVFFKIDPDIDNNDSNYQMFIKKGYKHKGFNMNFEHSQPRFTFRLNLAQIETNDIINVFDPKRKAAIKVAQKNNLSIVDADDNGVAFYDLMAKTAIRQGFAIHNSHYFETLRTTYANSNKLDLKYAILEFDKTNDKLAAQVADLTSQVALLQERAITKKSQNKMNELQGQIDRMLRLIEQNKQQSEQYGNQVIIAAAMIIYEGNKAWYVYGASDEQFSHLCAVDLMQLECITHAKMRGVEIYDFFGTTGDTSSDNPLHGIYQFKKKYGGQFTEFIGEFDYILKPTLYYLFDHLYPVVLAFLVNRRIKRK